MKSRSKFIFGLAVVGFLAVVVRAQEPLTPIQVEPIQVQPIDVQPAEISALSRPDPPAGPVNLVGAIPVPGGFASSDILWVDQPSGRLFVTDRTNRAIDIFDAVNDVYVTRVTGFVGPTGAPGVTNGPGPNGVLVTPDNIMFVGDGNSLLQAVDLNLSPPQITHTISVGGPTDGRADELGYDPIERVVLVANNASVPPHLTFVSADTYRVLGQITLSDATGLEQPWWDAQLHRFLVTVPATPPYVAVIDPRSMRVRKKYTIPGCPGPNMNGIILGPFQRMLVSACGRPYIMNAIDGHVIKMITQVGGGDEVWYNAGDNRYYVTSTDSTGQTVLGVIDGETSAWIQNVPAPGARNPSAFVGNNHVFAAVAAPAAPRTASVCLQFGLQDTGCIAVFSHN